MAPPAVGAPVPGASRDRGAPSSHRSDEDGRPEETVAEVEVAVTAPDEPSAPAAE
jgi:hypothetical protein